MFRFTGINISIYSLIHTSIFIRLDSDTKYNIAVCTGCLILFLYTLIGWYGNNNDFLAIKMVFICSTHNEIWYHVVLIRAVPHILTHLAFEKKLTI